MSERMNPQIASLQVGLPQDLGHEDAPDPMDRPWRTGFIKRPVTGPVWLAHENLAGDGQADLVHHGGPDKAVLLYSASHYPAWREELELPDLPQGAFGENFTMNGQDESLVCIGDTWQIGDDALIQISQPRQPCWKLARRWRIKTLPLQVQQTGRTGWYCRVLREGYVSAGMLLTLLDRPVPRWTVARANQVMHLKKKDFAQALELAAIPQLSTNWRQTLIHRTEGHERDPAQRLIGENT